MVQRVLGAIGVLTALIFVLLGLPVEYPIFVVTLTAVICDHHRRTNWALAGLLAMSLYKGIFTETDLLAHYAHEAPGIANLGGLLLGFAVLAATFTMSKVPQWMPKVLPDDWKGGFVLLLLIFVMSMILDNIAAALIGAVVAKKVFHKVHVSYVGAIVLASNAGGAGSVLGDTTTTMLWLAGANWMWVLEAMIGGLIAVLISGFIASRQQQAFSPIKKDPSHVVHLDLPKLGVVFCMLVGAVVANVGLGIPSLGVWAVIIIAFVWNLLPENGVLRHEVKGAAIGAIFLLSLVMTASMVPIESLPVQGPVTLLGFSVVSGVFDNIPLTKLMINQNHYDWGFVAFGIGAFGSWSPFGSSAGVAVTTEFPEAADFWPWVKGAGWHILLGCFAGFFTMWAVLGWHAHDIGGMIGH